MSSEQGYSLTVNPAIKNLLLSALGMVKFTIMHENHPFADSIRESGLLTESQIDAFVTKIKSTKDGHNIIMALEDEIFIYSILDLTCKAYLTDLGDEMEELNKRAGNYSKSSFAEVRDTILKGCSFVLEGMKESLKGNEEFEERIAVLETMIRIE